jgi:ribosomal protein L16 Arg81 hydroxylase
MDFAEFIAPMPVSEFMADYFGHRPVHIQDGVPARLGLFSLSRLEQLMSARRHWTEDNLKLILNSSPIFADHFLENAADNAAARYADPAKVQLFVRMGASLVADHIEDVDTAVRAVTAMLSERFAGTAGANAYSSLKDVQAFNSHCDLHEVFAIQLEGEKVWRIYENRADSPVETIQGPNAQSIIDRAKGRVLMTVRMRPGDLLYIPRGFFHDALADDGHSLHLTFGVAPLDGRYIFDLLKQLATRDAKFRAYLPNGRAEPEALRAHLASLADEVGRLLRSHLLESTLAGRQAALARAPHVPNLGDQEKLDHLARTDQPAEVQWRLDGAVLRHGAGDTPLGPIAEPMEWAIEQGAFSEQQLRARFHWLSDAEATRVVDLVTKAGLFVRYEPRI